MQQEVSDLAAETKPACGLNISEFPLVLFNCPPEPPVVRVARAGAFCFRDTEVVAADKPSLATVLSVSEPNYGVEHKQCVCVCVFVGQN